MRLHDTCMMFDGEHHSTNHIIVQLHVHVPINWGVSKSWGGGGGGVGQGQQVLGGGGSDKVSKSLFFSFIAVSLATTRVPF